jgi:integrase/recombinase XerC
LDVRAPKAAKPLPKALGVDAAVALAEFKSVLGEGKTPLSHRDISPALQGQLRHTHSALNQLIVELLYGSGLRVSELVGLDIAASQDAINAGRGWIDADSGDVHVYGKGSKRRMVPLSSKAKIALAQYLPARSAQLVSLDEAASPEAALLLSPKGVRLTRQAVWGLLKKRSLASGLDTPVHPHMLRHSFASHVLQSSGDLRAVQELLGHSSIASTQVYTRLDFQHLAKIYDNAHPRAKLNKGFI